MQFSALTLIVAALIAATDPVSAREH